MAVAVRVMRNSEEKMNFGADLVVRSLNEIINIIQGEKRKCDDRHKEG